MRELFKRSLLFLRRALFVAGGMAACLLGALSFFGARHSDEAADCIVVFGAAVRKGEKPSDALQYRLEHALELFKAGRAKTIIVTGGGEGRYEEARIMAQWLQNRGVARELIVEDSESATTRESGLNVARLMRQHGLRSALVVSQWFHVSRCRLVLDQAGVQQTFAAPCGGNKLRRETFYVAREMLGLPAYLLRLDELRS